MWLIYALGGGWGHLTRAAALARASEYPVRILTNSPYANYVQSAMPALDLVILPPAITPGESAAVIHRELEAKPQCLIVDTFPRGLGGELAVILPSVAAQRVLVHRDLTPPYIEAAKLHEFVAAHYGLVLIPGRDEEAAIEGTRTAAWLVRSPGEVSQEKRLEVLVLASGRVEEAAWYGEVAARLSGRIAVRCVAAELPPGCPPQLWTRHWPAVDLIAQAAVVVGGAGYNTVAECRACGVPLIARAWPRKYDRQDLRARHADAVVTTVEEAVAEALTRGASQRARPGKAAAVENGAIEAVRLIAQALRATRVSGS